MKDFFGKYWLLIISGFILLVAPYTLTRNYLIKSLDFSTTGQIGDTIGGITAPFINFIGFIFIYLALKEQRVSNKLTEDQVREQALQFTKTTEDQQRQIDYQRKQYHERRITDIIYKNLDRIDQITSYQTFVLNNYPNSNKNGYAGFNLFIKALDQETANSNNYRNGDHTGTDNFFVANISPLAEVYNAISKVVGVIDSLIGDSELDTEQCLKLKKLLALILGESIVKGTDKINSFINSYQEREACQEVQERVWLDTESRDRLEKAVTLVYNFFKKVKEDTLENTI